MALRSSDWVRGFSAGIACAVGLTLTSVHAAELTVDVTPAFRDEPLVFDSLSLTNAAGQLFSVTRLDLLVSDFAVRRPDGAWLMATNWQAYLGLSTDRRTFRVDSLPTGTYDRVRFHVGLRPEWNHADPKVFPADHPLNPDLNGLHWTWQGGYVFLALEGRWRTADGSLSGYSYHLANDEHLMLAEAPIDLVINQPVTLSMELNLDQILGGSPPTQFTSETNSTHSRQSDTLATRLCLQASTAFSISASVPSPPSPSFIPHPSTLMPPSATPYRFTFGSQFPLPDLPRDNPLTVEGVALGERLFHEASLSINSQQSCATCHHPESAFVDPSRAMSLGAEGRSTARNSMSVFNLAWKREFFWDGRAPDLRAQVIVPLQHPDEMHETLTNVVAKLTRSPSTNYPALFAAAFGSPDITPNRLVLALEQFLLTRVSHDARFDRVMFGAAEPTPEEKQGFTLFFTEYDPARGFRGADCFHCHAGPFFTNRRFANNGLDLEPRDAGRYAVTKLDRDRGAFAVPSLRNVARTAPYMHDGRFATLEDAVEHYRSGVQRSPTLDPNLAKHPPGGIPFSDADKRALVAFLNMLTDESLTGTSVTAVAVSP